MLAPGERRLAGYDPADGAGPGSPELSALAGALSRLAEASDGVADAVVRHDRLALLSCTERAEALVDEVGRINAALSDQERALLPGIGVPELCERLAAGARRNAYLIEQAWATDAALMRLLLGLGRVGSDGSLSGYSANPGPTYVDRGA